MKKYLALILTLCLAFSALTSVSLAEEEDNSSYVTFDASILNSFELTAEEWCSKSLYRAYFSFAIIVEARDYFEWEDIPIDLLTDSYVLIDKSSSLYFLGFDKDHTTIYLISYTPHLKTVIYATYALESPLTKQTLRKAYVQSIAEELDYILYENDLDDLLTVAKYMSNK